jgi:hypothetical protein
MAENRDVKCDAGGKPLAKLGAAGEEAGCSWCQFIVDMSGIGLPTDTPLLVRSRDGDTFLSWRLGRIPLAQTPKALTPPEAAAIMDIDTLLAALGGLSRLTRLCLEPR